MYDARRADRIQAGRHPVQDGRHFGERQGSLSDTFPKRHPFQNSITMKCCSSSSPMPKVVTMFGWDSRATARAARFRRVIVATRCSEFRESST